MTTPGERRATSRARRTILIAGPTASGKSALALALAERLNGAVINADAMQVYRDFRVLTARPTPQEEALVPHALYGFVPAEVAYSAGRYAADAAKAIAAVREAGRLPILVGGTGLYFKALLEGLAPIPSIPENIRAHWRREAEKYGAPALHTVLSRRDPEAALRLKPGDTQRLVRALEVLDATGTSLTVWQKRPGAPVLEESSAVRLVASRPREELYQRIEARFRVMLREGAMEEVAAVAARGLDSALPALRAHGVPALLAFLAGRISLEEAISWGVADTRHYAKRQLTWLRRNMISWIPIDMKQMKCEIGKVVTKIERGD